MRQKLEQEMGRLKQKYQPRGDKMPETVCLVNIAMSVPHSFEQRLSDRRGRRLRCDCWWSGGLYL